MEVILLGWFFNLGSIREHANLSSDFKVGKWWDFMIRFVTPLVLGINWILNFIVDLQNHYSGYSTLAQLVFGWILVIVLIVIALLVARMGWQNEAAPAVGEDK